MNRAARTNLGVGLVVKSVFLQLCWKAKGSSVYAGRDMLADALECNERTIRRAVARLETGGWLVPDGWHYNGNARYRRWTISADRLVELDSQSTSGGVELDSQSSGPEVQLDSQSSRTGLSVPHKRLVTTDK